MKSVFKHMVLLMMLYSAYNQSVAQSVKIMVLGISQDGGYPQTACMKSCCQQVWTGDSERHYVSSLAIIDEKNGSVWLIDCSPDLREQWKMITDYLTPRIPVLKGIFLTHAHIGHYAGLMQLGKEVMSTSNIPVYAMPRMSDFLKKNGPWNQLTELKNIEIKELTDQSVVEISPGFSLRPLPVPHLDEYSETVGFMVYGKTRKVIYIPDINKWELWKSDLKSVIQSSDYAFIDGTFYDSNELPGRNMEEIPHPLVTETMNLLESLDFADKQKVHFIHFNHSNPLHFDVAKQTEVEKKGFKVARQASTFDL